MVLSTTVATTLGLHNPSIAEIANWIPYLNLQFRKIFLTCCQTGLSAKSSHRIEHDLHRVYMEYGPISSEDDKLTLERLEHMTNSLDASLSSWMTRSIVSMLIRCLPMSHFTDDSDEVLQAGIRKEINASQTTFRETQQMDYSWPFGIHIPGVEWPLTPHWKNHSQRFASRLLASIRRFRHILYPTPLCQKRT